MPNVSGLTTKMNKIQGLTCLIEITDEELKNPISDQVFCPNVLCVLPNRAVILTDGVTKVRDQQPIIDNILLETEKLALVKTFSGDDYSYRATEGGFVLLQEDGRIEAPILPEELFDSTSGKFKLAALPDIVRAGVTYVNDIAARDAIVVNNETKRKLVIVIDATGDPTVDSGSAMYIWSQIGDTPTNMGWVKIAETESLDINIDELKPTYENIQKAGAVMRDHTLNITVPTMTELVDILDK